MMVEISAERWIHTNRMLTKSGHTIGMPNDPEHSFASRQVGQARNDFAAIESDLDMIHKQLERQPARRDLSRH